MNRFLQYFNLLGILTLAGLCGMQWRANREINLRAMMLERTRLDQVATIAERDKTIKGITADLEDFCQRLILSEAALKESEEKFKSLAAERDQLATERDQLKENLETWKAAVAARDVELKKAAYQIEKLAADRNDAVSKFNDLAEKYNGLVKQTDKSKPNQ